MGKSICIVIFGAIAIILASNCDATSRHLIGDLLGGEWLLNGGVGSPSSTDGGLLGGVDNLLGGEGLVNAPSIGGGLLGGVGDLLGGGVGGILGRIGGLLGGEGLLNGGVGNSPSTSEITP